MTLKIHKNLAPVRAGVNCFGTGNPKKYVTVHQTGNTSSGANADMHARLQKRVYPNASWHWQVDDKEAIQSFEHNVKCWHASDGYGAGNTQSIAVEICINRDGNYRKSVENGAKLVAYILNKEGLSINKVYQHNHWDKVYRKNCPAQIRAGKDGINWNKFLQMVETELAKLKGTKPVVSSSSSKPNIQKPNAPKSNTNTIKKLHLPSTATSWRIYKPQGKYTKGNEIGYLKPKKYGGLIYDIKGNPARDIYLIDTRDFGRVAIYAGKGTGAKITYGASSKKVSSTTSKQKNTPAKKTDVLLKGIINTRKESGTFYPNTTILISSAPRTTNRKVIGKYHKGQSVHYHTVHTGNGYVWIEYTSYSGKRRFLPIRTYKNGKQGTMWGHIK